MAMGKSPEAPQQHKQPSRKGRKSWRKNIDDSDLQAGLEEARAEVTKGGIIAEKLSESLFAIDTVGSEAIRASYYKANKPLTTDSILAQRSAVLAIHSCKRATIIGGVNGPSNKRRKSDGVSNKEYNRLRDIAHRGQSVKAIIETNDAPAYDPWTPRHEEERLDPRFSYLERQKPIRAPVTLKEAPVTLAAGTETIPAVTVPKGETSYNPNFQDWDALITFEGQKEVEAEKKRLFEAKAERRVLDRIAAAQNERSTDIQTEDESAWEGLESDREATEWSKKRKSVRKTPAERNRAKRRKDAERTSKWKKKEKERQKQENQIAVIVKKIQEQAKAKIVVKKAEGGSEGAHNVDERVSRRRKLGKHVLPKPPLELVLPDELRDSLRLLKPEGNLLKDRFRNILISGRVETRKPIQQSKKKRRSLTEKWSYKDWSLEV